MNKPGESFALRRPTGSKDGHIHDATRGLARFTFCSALNHGPKNASWHSARPGEQPPALSEGATGSNPTRQGIAFAVLTACLFSGSDALIKQLVLTAPFLFVMWLRYVFQSGLLVAWIVARRNGAALRVGSWRLQALRCTLLAISSSSGYLALRHVPLAEYTALMMMAPVVSVVLGRLVLKERVVPLQWLCVALGLVGMLAVVRPGLASWSAHAWLPVFSACCYAGFQMTSRKVMLASDIVTSSLLSALFIVVAVGLALLIWPEDWGQMFAGLEGGWWLQFVMMCLIATGGQVSLAAALQKSSLSVAAPFAYLQILFAALIGLLFFGHWPDALALVGTLLIVVAGVGSAWLNGRAPVPQTQR